jgi:hypothetical protein
MQSIDVELINAATLIDGDVPMGGDPVALSRQGEKPLSLVAPHHASELRTDVLQGEIAMTGRCPRKARHLALDPEVAELFIAIEERLDVLGDLADRLDLHGRIIPYSGLGAEVVCQAMVVAYQPELARTCASEASDSTPCTQVGVDTLSE